MDIEILKRGSDKPNLPEATALKLTNQGLLNILLLEKA